MAKYRAKQKSIMHNNGAGGGFLKAAAAGTDWLTIALCLLCSAFGMLLVYSATYSADELSNRMVLGILPRQVFIMILGVALGLAAALAMSFVDYELLLRFWYVLAGVCLLLMFLLFTPLAVHPPGREDSNVWLPLPGGQSFQPSELLKTAFIVSFAWHLQRVHKRINRLRQILLLGLHALVPFGLVVISGDMGSALVFLCITAGMLFLAGLKLRWFAAVFTLGAAAAPLIWFKILKNLQRERIQAVYFKGSLPEKDYARVIYQQQQAQIAIG
ncbi:MAG: FtsW/RodA/SpoVE family cell cycle protein, partial [Oscillospiraceae bacterium]|nr:FtsW/RodA/SpoVE family cell cycle protein [Oscillospiraceae bacterium]